MVFILIDYKFLFFKKLKVWYAQDRAHQLLAFA